MDKIFLIVILTPVVLFLITIITIFFCKFVEWMIDVIEGDK